MNIKEYCEYVFEQIKVDAASELISTREAFFKNYSETLMDSEEIESFEYLPFEGIGKNRRKIQIDGYTYDEFDDVLSLFIGPSLTDFSGETLTSTEADKSFNKAVSFIEDADMILENAEESAPGYGLAYDITKKYSIVKKYRIFLFTDMVMSKQIKRLEQGTINGKIVEYHIWDTERIYNLAESGVVKEDVIIDLREYGTNGVPCLMASKTEDYEAYLCNIPGQLLATIYNKFGGRLLEGNVRSFLQTKGKVNKGIRNTILNNPTLFFAYNNGIAATASNVEMSFIDGIPHIIKITALQIVNGGQTTASLAMALLNDKKEDSENKIAQISVPMKLSIVNHEKAVLLIPEISRYANSQNKVSDSDLWSNHPFHIRMENFSRRIKAPATEGRQYGTSWYYERANGQYQQETYKSSISERNKFEMANPKNQMFKKIDLAKFMNIYEMLPHIASAGGQKSFSKFADSVTSQWGKSDIEFNEDYYRRVICMAIMFKETDKIVKLQTWFKNSYKANIVAYTISKLIYTIERQYPERSIPYKTIWQLQKLPSSWIKQIENISELMYNHLVSDDREVENVTEWAKREGCWNSAKSIKVILQPQFVNDLIYKSSVVEDKKDAKDIMKQDKNIDYMLQVHSFGPENWKFLLNWGSDRSLLSITDKSFIGAAIAIEKGRFPSESQCKKIIEILERLRIEAFPK